MEMDNKLTADLEARIAFLENVLECLPVGVLVLDSRGEILLANRAQEKISRIKREDVLGLCFHEKWNSLLSRTELGECYWAMMHQNKPYEYVFHNVLPQFFDVKISGIGLGAPLKDESGFVLLHHISDKIREDKHALAVLANNLGESKQILQSLYDSSPSALFTLAKDGTIRSSNRTATRIFRYSKGDLFWKSVSILFEENIVIDDLFYRVSLNSGVEVICRRKGGDFFPARIQGSDIETEDGVVQEKLLIITDISREKDLEERLAISEKLAIYSELIAGIFHQINNPLVGVVNFSSILLEKMEEGDVNRRLVETIHDASIECKSLIASMVKGFREPESNFRRVSLLECLEHAVDEASRKHQKESGGILLVKKFDLCLPEVNGDLLQLGQVFRNLLDNAFQAMPDGGRLEIGTSIDESRREVLIRVADSGFGIPKENQSKIFTPFFSTKKNTGGGLGLSFAFQVVKSHAGRILVESDEGMGSIFTVVLPFGSNDKQKAGC
jgi:PAS domain S-box-containing protein